MIRTEALSFSYVESIQVLREINLELRDGEFLALLGPNGCGKTTLLKHLNGLLKPSSGKVFIDDKELILCRDEDIFQRVGSPAERKKVIEGGPCLVLATSGMLVGGASVEYLREFASNKKNSICFVCYQPQGGLGRQIQEGLL